MFDHVVYLQKISLDNHDESRMWAISFTLNGGIWGETRGGTQEMGGPNSTFTKTNYLEERSGWVWVRASKLTGVLLARPTSLKRGEGHLVWYLRVIVKFREAGVKVLVVGMEEDQPTSTGCRIQTPFTLPMIVLALNICYNNNNDDKVGMCLEYEWERIQKFRPKCRKTEMLFKEHGACPKEERPEITTVLSLNLRNLDIFSNK